MSLADVCLLSLGRAGLIASSIQSSLAPAGEQAARIAHLWWIYFWVLISIFGLVAIFLFLAILRRRSPAEVPLEGPITTPQIGSERRVSNTVISCVIATVIILFVLLFIDMFVGRDVYALASSDPNPLVVKITGHQWWWEVQYEDPSPDKVMVTANEMHVPIGKVVRVELRSADVIHSFWVPTMLGKKDLIPGHPTTTWLKADQEGTFRGQCAEFCGHQHAHMRMEFISESPEKFESWLAAARQNAQPPATDTARRGEQVFISNQCVMCHSIQGTNARATTGPDLTHIASRQMLAAGAVPNTRGYLAGWIANPQNVKPGVRMPANPLSSDDLNALIDYLEGLK
jgi:cytochrome c oxidase subunit II